MMLEPAGHQSPGDCPSSLVPAEAKKLDKVGRAAVIFKST